VSDPARNQHFAAHLWSATPSPVASSRAWPGTSSPPSLRGAPGQSYPQQLRPAKAPCSQAIRSPLLPTIQTEYDCGSWSEATQMPGYPPQIDGVDRWESGARYAGHFFSCLWAGGSDVPDPAPPTPITDVSLGLTRYFPSRHTCTAWS